MRVFIKKVKTIAYIISLSMVSFNLYADVTMNDSAENLLNAKVTTLIDFNNPKTRAAYAYAQIGTIGVPLIFTPDDQGHSATLMAAQLLETKAVEGDLIYWVEVDVQGYWLRDERYYPPIHNRFTSDVFLPKNNSYKIERSSVGSFYHLTTESVYKWIDGRDGQGRDIEKSISLHIGIQRNKVIKHHCSSKDSKDVVKACKGRKNILRMQIFNDDFSIGEVTSVLKPIVSIDLNTIPKVVIPGNSN